VIVENYLEVNHLLSPPVPEALIEEYYEKNGHALKLGESRRVRHLLLKVPATASAAEEAAVRERIEAIRKVVASGREKLADAARKHSQCDTAPLGGELGDIKRGFMPAKFDDVAFAAPVGKVSEVVRTKHGFHLLEVVGVTPARMPALDEVREVVTKLLARNLSQKAIAEHVAKLRSEAKIEVLLASAAAKGT
jgi:peptidyl-prolyl cis-trans isomerase C